MFGKKIENLRILRDAQFPVPDFLVVERGADGYKVVPERGFAEAFSLESIPWEVCSVRSAAGVEDGADASFAGQFDTFLNVTREEVSKKVSECFASMEKECVKLYAKEQKLDASGMGMHVMVQEMIPAEYSGVCFTANPQGLLNEMVIVAGRGTGDNVVEDKVSATSYYYNVTDKIYYYEGEEDSLSSDLIAQIVELATKMQPLLGELLDIEFAVAEGKVYILQARNITTLKADKPLILDNSNIVESYPGLSLPLTCSFVNIVYSGIFRSISRRVLKNEKELKKHDHVFANMVGNVNGRIYYKISNWYTVIKFLPMNYKIIPIWQDMLGVKVRSYDAEAVRLSKFLRAKTYFNVVWEMLSVPRNMKRLNRDFIRINEGFYEKYHEKIAPKELLELYRELHDTLLSCWDVTLLNDMYSFLFTGILKKRLGEQSNQVISGISNIESLKPIKEMVRLAYEKKNMTEAEFDRQCAEYIREYGDRNLEELKLESETFRSNPELLTEKLMQYNEDANKLEEMYHRLHGKDGAGAEEAPIYKLRGINRFLAKEAARGIANREISRLNRSRIFGIVRLIFLRIGEVFAESGLISETRDIFWLTVEEVFETVEKQDGEKEKALKDIIEARKQQYELYQHLPPYQRLIFAEKEFDKKHKRVNSYSAHQNPNVLQGIPCSDGVAEGEVLVVTDVTKVKDYQDKILVTKMTDPGWVFLLVRAKGVISEKGSLLSHTAIISRELKIPSVVGVEGLLNSLKTGDVVRMNGNTGEIEIIKR